MYSSLQNVQILVAMLKKKGIKSIVCSPGNSHNAILRSLEEDSYFKTYNIVDERSAAFFACGLIQELNEPVAICCTAGTAATNYLTGVTEAYRRNLPMIVITADKNPYYLAQHEDQMIDQISIFDSVTKYNCSLPIIKDKKDVWYCNRIINEAFLEMDHHGSGPIKINVVIEEGMLAIGSSFQCKELPEVKLINRYDLSRERSASVEKVKQLQNKKVLVLCGQETNNNSKIEKLITKVFRKYNCVFATDKLSNLHSEGTFEIARVDVGLTEIKEELMPDVVISIGGNTAINFKFKLKNTDKKFEHWIVNEEGRVADPFKRLTTIFEGSPEEFLCCLNDAVSEVSEHSYYSAWEMQKSRFLIPEFEFSNLYSVKRLMEDMPQNSILNLGNSTTIRIAQYFDINPKIKIYCNRGVNGIDGCVSTFVGQSAMTDKLSFLIVGDLTFFYDMNALWNRYLGNNVRIMMNNNEGAALFHFNQGLLNYPTLNENVAAQHGTSAKGWAKSLGIKYISAKNKEEFETGLKEFISLDANQPILFEVFSDKAQDAKLQHDFFDANRDYTNNEKLKKGLKNMVKNVLGDDLVTKIKNR